MKVRDKETKGITLIALIITIIILLILAGISISALGGENGLFTRAKQAKNNTLDAQNAENQALTGYETKIHEVVGGSGGGAISAADNAAAILVNANAISTEKGRAEGVEGGLRTDLGQKTDSENKEEESTDYYDEEGNEG